MNLTTEELKDILYATKGFQSMSELNEKLKAEIHRRNTEPCLFDQSVFNEVK